MSGLSWAAEAALERLLEVLEEDPQNGAPPGLSARGSFCPSVSSQLAHPTSRWCTEHHAPSNQNHPTRHPSQSRHRDRLSECSQQTLCGRTQCCRTGPGVRKTQSSPRDQSGRGAPLRLVLRRRKPLPRAEDHGWRLLPSVPWAELRVSLDARGIRSRRHVWGHMKPRDMFAQQWPSGIYHNFLPHPSLYSTSGPDPITPVRVLPDEAGTYWAWWDAQRDEVDFIHSQRGLVSMCFPYGPEIEEKQGRGKVIRVRVERRETSPFP